MWTPLRREIEKIRKELGLIEKFIPVGLTEWQGIEDRIYETFCTIKTHRSRPIWIWERLRVKAMGVRPEGNPNQLLGKLIDQDEHIFLLLSETVKETTKFWIYESTVEPVQTILDESAETDEVIIVDKKYNWIVCINHHDDIIVGGDKMVDRLERTCNA
jgi:hypothetical protein